MIHSLISLNADLASSIALRFACRLTQFVDMRLQTIHVEEVEKEGFHRAAAGCAAPGKRDFCRRHRRKSPS